MARLALIILVAPPYRLEEGDGEKQMQKSFFSSIFFNCISICFSVKSSLYLKFYLVIISIIVEFFIPFMTEYQRDAWISGRHTSDVVYMIKKTNYT